MNEKYSRSSVWIFEQLNSNWLLALMVGQCDWFDIALAFAMCVIAMAFGRETFSTRVFSYVPHCHIREGKRSCWIRWIPPPYCVNHTNQINHYIFSMSNFDILIFTCKLFCKQCKQACRVNEEHWAMCLVEQIGLKHRSACVLRRCVGTPTKVCTSWPT